MASIASTSLDHQHNNRVAGLTAVVKFLESKLLETPVPSKNSNFQEEMSIIYSIYKQVIEEGIKSVKEVLSLQAGLTPLKKSAQRLDQLTGPQQAALQVAGRVFEAQVGQIEKTLKSLYGKVGVLENRIQELIRETQPAPLPKDWWLQLA